MTKTDLLEEVAGVIEVSRKDAYAIIETILDGIVHSVRRARRSRFPGGVVSISDRGGHGRAETQRRVHGWRFLRSGLRTSSRAKSCESW